MREFVAFKPLKYYYWNNFFLNCLTVASGGVKDPNNIYMFIFIIVIVPGLTPQIIFLIHNPVRIKVVTAVFFPLCRRSMWPETPANVPSLPRHRVLATPARPPLPKWTQSRPSRAIPTAPGGPTDTGRSRPGALPLVFGWNQRNQILLDR